HDTADSWRKLCRAAAGDPGLPARVPGPDGVICTQRAGERWPVYHAVRGGAVYSDGFLWDGDDSPPAPGERSRRQPVQRAIIANCRVAPVPLQSEYFEGTGASGYTAMRFRCNRGSRTPGS